MKLLKTTTAVICMGLLLSMTSCIFGKGGARGHAKGKGSTTVIVKKGHK